ncbi:MAG: OCRE domain-containing protein [Actinomycetota bacterium]
MPIHPSTGYLMHPATGLLYVPNTDYLMDPVTGEYFDRYTLLPVEGTKPPEPKPEKSEKPKKDKVTESDASMEPTSEPTPSSTADAAALGNGPPLAGQEERASSVGTSPLVRAGVAAGLIAIGFLYYIRLRSGRKPTLQQGARPGA